MGISKVQQQKWITTVQHNDFNIDIKKQQLVAQYCLQQLRQQNMESSLSSRWTRGATTIIESICNINQDHMHNNPVDIITSMIEGECIINNDVRSELSTIYGRNPTTTRRTTWVGYNNVTQTQWRSASTSRLSTTSLSPPRVRNIADVMTCRMINSVGTMFLQQRLHRQHGCGHRHPQQPQIENANHQEGCANIGSINISGHLVPQNNKGCVTQQFSANFSKANTRPDHQHSIGVDVDIQEEDINIECSDFSTTVSEWKTQPTTETSGRTTSRATWSIVSTTVLLEINFKDCTTKVIIDELNISKWLNNS